VAAGRTNEHRFHIG
jgi:hypothetical protein